MQKIDLEAFKKAQLVSRFEKIMSDFPNQIECPEKIGLLEACTALNESDLEFSINNKENYLFLTKKDVNNEYGINISIKTGIVETIIWVKLPNSEVMGGPLTRMTKLVQLTEPTVLFKPKYPFYRDLEELVKIIKEFHLIFQDFYSHFRSLQK